MYFVYLELILKLARIHSSPKNINSILLRKIIDLYVGIVFSLITAKYIVQ